jgi:hypothetical protein
MGGSSVPGMAMWKRMNIVLFTIGGGCIGFYVQDRHIQRHKAKLLSEVPVLEQQLLQLEEKRTQLEAQLFLEQQQLLAP